VLLPGFQKCRDIKASQGKGQGAVLAKKGQYDSYKKKLEKWTEWSIKFFPLTFPFNTFKTLQVAP
jgi:hypothetical protein